MLRREKPVWLRQLIDIYQSLSHISRKNIKIHHTIVFIIIMSITIYAGIKHSKKTEYKKMNNEGFTLLEQGKPDEAIKYLERAFELEPQNLKVINALAFAYQDCGFFKEAKDMYEKSLAIDPNQADIKQYLNDVNYELGL